MARKKTPAPIARSAVISINVFRIKGGRPVRSEHCLSGPSVIGLVTVGAPVSRYSIIMGFAFVETSLTKPALARDFSLLAWSAGADRVHAVLEPMLTGDMAPAG